MSDMEKGAEAEEKLKRVLEEGLHNSAKHTCLIRLSYLIRGRIDKCVPIPHQELTSRRSG